MARVEGKVAFITGAARGQGRSHAVRLAEEGADIVAVDLCGQIDSVPYGMATPDDLAETAKLVEEQDRRIVAAQAGAGHYIAAKHGVVGLMRTLANELAPHMIRVNTVHPTGVSTDMVQNDFFTAWAEQHPEIGAAMQNLLPVEMVEPRDISNAVLWLASDEARYVTGVALPVDAGITQK